MADRWATFDCYGTLIDWNGGILRELERLFGVQVAPRLLGRYHELEPEVQSQEYVSYREVLTLTLERLATEERLAIAEGETDAIAKGCRPATFPRCPARSRATSRGGSSPSSRTGPRSHAAERERIGVAVRSQDRSEEIPSYNPTTVNGGVLERTGADRIDTFTSPRGFQRRCARQRLGSRPYGSNRSGAPGARGNARASDLDRLLTHSTSSSRQTALTLALRGGRKAGRGRSFQRLSQAAVGTATRLRTRSRVWLTHPR